MNLPKTVIERMKKLCWYCDKKYIAKKYNSIDGKFRKVCKKHL